MRAGGWERGVWATNYLTRLPRVYMRRAAGFGNSPGSYFLRRGEHSPDLALQRQVWPWVDDALAAYKGGLFPDADKAGKKVLEMLLRLRCVFLQDAALLQPQFPELSLWRHQVFRDPLWPPFAAKIRELEAVEKELLHVAIHGVLPLVADSVDGVSNKVGGVAIKQDRTLNAVERLLSGQSQLTTTLSALPAANAQEIARVLGSQLSQLQATVSMLPRSFLTVPVEAVRRDWLLDEASWRGQATALATAAHSVGEEPAASASSYVDAAASLLPTPSVVLTSVPGEASTVSAPCGSLPQEGPPQRPPGCPAEPILGGVTSAEAVLEEFAVGTLVEGVRRTSLDELDRLFGAKWRYTPALRQRFYVKRRIRRYLQGKANEQGRDPWDIAREVDSLGLSGHQISKRIDAGEDLLCR